MMEPSDLIEVELKPAPEMSAASPSSDWKSRTASALQRRRLFLEAQREAKRMHAAQTRELEEQQKLRKQKSKLAKGIQSVGNALQRINIARWIDDLEKDQNIADQLERMNQENAEEQKRKEICRQAEEACLLAIRNHLDSFLEENPKGTYEDWIAELHPDNVREGKIDSRFYIQDSEHLVLWKDAHEKMNNDQQASGKNGDNELASTPEMNQQINEKNH